MITKMRAQNNHLEGSSDKFFSEKYHESTNRKEIYVKFMFYFLYGNEAYPNFCAPRERRIRRAYASAIMRETTMKCRQENTRNVLDRMMKSDAPAPMMRERQ